MSDPSFLLHLFLGPFLLAVALIFKRFPPKRINRVYGYRTRRSRASQAAWDLANRYSANCLVVGSLAMVGVQILLVLLLEPETSLLTALVLVCIVPVGIIPVVERKLKNKFE